jgi:hypothetical protein
MPYDVKLVERYARKAFGQDDEKVSRAIVLSWYYWSIAHDDSLPATIWARVGVRFAAAGRDLPGVQPSRKRDALDYATQGAGMDEVRDRRPGPDKVAQHREDMEVLKKTLTVREWIMFEAFRNGATNREVAKLLEVTPGRISQMVTGILRRWRR